MGEKILLDRVKCIKCRNIFAPKNNYVKVCDTCKKKSISEEKTVDTSLENPHITDEYKIQICKMLACFIPITKIITYFQKEHNFHIFYQNIKHIEGARRWTPIIERLRKDWIDNIYTVPISNRRYRLEAYDDIYNKAMGKEKPAYTIAMKALEGAREETDEKKIGSTSYTLNYISNMTDEELQKKKIEIINRIKRMPKLRDEPIDLGAEDAGEVETEVKKME